MLGIRVYGLSLKEKKKKSCVLHPFLERIIKKELHSSFEIGSVLYSILRENPLAKLVSDPLFCAGVTIQVGLCAFHSPVFCGTRSAGSARVLCGAGGLTPRARQGVLRAVGVSQSAEGLTLLRRHIFTFSGVRLQQTATFGSYARYFPGFINNRMSPVGIDCCS